jgi:hypothetical protein
MKKPLLIVLSILFSFLVIAQNSSAISEGSLANGKFVLNKKEISKDWKLLTAITVLKKANRINEGPANKVYLYDKYGIVLYEGKKNGKPTGIISEVNIYFSIKESNQLTPYNLFPGNFEIENTKITKDSKGEDISKILENKGYKKKGNYWYVKNGIYIILMVSDNGLLQNISIGKDK